MRSTHREVLCYFQYARVGVEVEREGLEDLPFGAYLVEKNALTRAQLLRALQEQDFQPGVRIGEVIAYLGFLSYAEVDRWLTAYHALPVIEV